MSKLPDSNEPGGEESDLNKIYCAVWATFARSVVCVYDVL